MKALTSILASIVQRIRDEKLLWLLGVLILAVIAGLRDWIIFIAVLVVGVLVSIFSYTFQRKTCVPLAIIFKDRDAADIQLSKCEFELRDSQNNLKKKGEMAFSLDVNSWVCYLPNETEPEDIVRLFLIERNDMHWETGPFRPLFSSKEAEQVN